MGFSTFTAPSQPGPYTLQVLVTDGKTWSSGSVVIPVVGAQGTNGTGNHPASIQSLVALTSFVTYDKRLASAAQAHGLDVVAPS